MRKPYGNKTTTIETIQACLKLIERINLLRLTSNKFNIRYEDPMKCANKLKESKSEEQYKEFRRLYKKATRYNIKTDDVWDNNKIGE